LEVLVIIAAIWLMLLGIYGGYSLVVSSRRRRVRRDQGTVTPAEIPARPAGPRPTTSPALASEVEMLRAQVEHLRSEVVALSGEPPPDARPRIRRYRAGAYTDLPRTLRRQVRQVRSVRHTTRV
jgi:hypothetical protein